MYPWVRQGQGASPEEIRSVLDTGSAERLVIPTDRAQQIGLGPIYPTRVRFPNGMTVQVGTCSGEILWLGVWQPVNVTVLDRGSPLLGLPLLKDTRIVLRQEDGYVEPMTGP